MVPPPWPPPPGPRRPPGAAANAQPTAGRRRRAAARVRAPRASSVMFNTLVSSATKAAEAASDTLDALRGAVPYAARLAKGSVRSGYLAGLGPNGNWQRRFFVLKPTTMLYYFGSRDDEEPLGVVDVEAFSSVTCADVGVDGAVTIKLGRGEGDDAAAFGLKSAGEEEGYAWIDALKNESYARLKETNVFLQTQCDEFAGEIARLEEVARRAAVTAASAVHEASAARAGREFVLDGVDALYAELADSDGTGTPRAKAGEATRDADLLRALERLIGARAAAAEKARRAADDAVAGRRSDARSHAEALEVERTRGRRLAADLSAARSAAAKLKDQHRILVREVRKVREAAASAAPPASAPAPRADDDPEESSAAAVPVEEEEGPLPAPPPPPPPPPPPRPGSPRESEEERAARSRARDAFKAEVGRCVRDALATESDGESDDGGATDGGEDASDGGSSVASVRDFTPGGGADDAWLDDDGDDKPAVLDPPGREIVTRSAAEPLSEIVRVVYERARIGINFDIRADALVVVGVNGDYDESLARPPAGAALVGINGASVADVAPEEVAAQLRAAPRPLALAFLGRFAI